MLNIGKGVVSGGEGVVPGEVQQTLLVSCRGLKHFFTYPGWPCATINLNHRQLGG